MKYWFLICGLVFLTACVNNSSPESAEESDSFVGQTVIPSLGGEIKFNKFCPHSYCQSYSISLPDKSDILQVLLFDDEVRYKKLSISQIEELNHLVDGLGLTSMKTKITPHSPQCPRFSTDGINYQLIIQKGRFAQELKVDMGCHNLDGKYLSLINWFETKSTAHPEF